MIARIITWLIKNEPFITWLFVILLVLSIAGALELEGKNGL